MKKISFIFISLFFFSVQSWAQEDGDYSLEDASAGLRYAKPAGSSNATRPRSTRNTSKAASKPRSTQSKSLPNNVRSDRASDPGAAKNNAQTSTGMPTQEYTAVRQAIEKCQAKLVEARNDCDVDQDTGVQTSEGELKNLATNVGRMGFSACTALGKGIAGANGALAAFSITCSGTKKDCTSLCQVALSGAKASNNVNDIMFAETQLQGCKALDAKVQQAGAQMQSVMGTIQDAQGCSKDTTTELYDFCKNNPGALGCSTESTDCSNPAIAASSPICICKANPSAATCGGANLKADGNGMGSYDSASLGGNAPGTSGSIDSGGILGDDSWGGNPNAKSDNSRAEDVGGSKGGRPLDEGGGGRGGGGKDGGGGPGGPGTSVAVNAGFRGGGGGGGSFGGGGSEGTWAAEGQPAPGTAANGNPDLRNFLPGGKFDPKTRGLAGMSGPDGITGPHTDIWKKIQNRYQVKQPSLMP